MKAIAFSPDGTILATGSLTTGLSFDGTVRLWEISTGKEFLVLPVIENATGGGLAFSLDGDLLAVVASYSVRLWDLSSGQEVTSSQKYSDMISSMVFEGGRLRAIGECCVDEVVQVWGNATTHESPVLPEKVSGSCFQCAYAFSPDGTLVALGDRNNVILLWDIDTNQEIGRLQGHEAFITSLAFSPEGKLLASGSEDNTVRIWDMANIR